MLLRLLLAWAAAVPTLGQGPWATGPHAACGPDSCYALFPRRCTFLEAWRACRELGGDLATPRTPEEAQRVDSLVGAGPAGQLLWIGLQRQARQCQPQRPLRGFTWTTGDQDTDFTNWAQPATGGPCPAQRCVALEANGEHRWLEGSCTLAVDGYLCQFGFEGSCPALPEEAGQAGPAVYTTPFHLVSTEFEWLPFGSVAAVPCQAGREASLLCVKQPGGGVRWSRAGPLCPGTSCGPDNGGCEHECVEEVDGRTSCRCAEGFQLAADGHSCEDPCAHAPCEQQCEPGGPQGYSCHCHLGFRPADDDPHRCVDTDECQVIGVCQQMCVNYVGGFECYCSEGHELEADGISCSPAGDIGAQASQDIEDELLDDREDEEDEEDEEKRGNINGDWTGMPGTPRRKAMHPPDFGLAYRPSFPEDGEPQMPYLDPTWPPPLSAPRAPYHSSVLSVTRPVVVSATRPTLPSARQPTIISAIRRPLAPAPQPPRISAMHPALPPDHQFPTIAANYPDLPSVHKPLIISATRPARPPAHLPPVSSARHPELSTAHQSPMFPETQVADTQNTTPLLRIPANHTLLGTPSSAHHPPVTPDVPVLKSQATHLPITSPAQPPPITTSRFPLPTAHQARAPAAAQPPVPHTRLPPQTSANRAAPASPTHAYSKAPQVPREDAPDPKLTPWLSSAVPSAVPTALGEASTAGRSRRDDRWLLVALLVPTCVFLVVLLALGIVYCTRCGPHAPNKRITDCYRWVTHAGNKGPTEPMPHRGSLTGVQTCRTSV
ncbi:endosialin isoform X2 [Pteronotus mesoamericanus]|uniref:endosialin isoform X2 n=1 Tax=Pteronotus mesoamericanus TaxID=1884717 RepID=UPI0023ECA28D|nr:endosialin isoform X2 [Pteronotus parnellii mesoamericanus]